MAGTQTDDGSAKSPPLKGSPANPGRDPKVMTQADKKSLGYIALRDAVVMLVIAWLIVLAFYFSLRHFNI